MILKQFDKDLLKIQQIRKLRSIKLIDLFLSEANGKKFLVPGFLITYDDPINIMFLTVNDKYFYEYVRKIKNLYLEDKDKVIREGIMGKEYIQIDPISKNVLLNGTLENLEELEKYYQEKEGYVESLFFEEDKIKANFMIIEYHLRKMLENFNLTIGSMECSRGMNEIYHIKTTVQNIPTILPIQYEEDDNEWNINIGNIFENSIPILLKGMITKEGITVSGSIIEYNYYDNTSYSFHNKKLWKEREIYHNGQMVWWKEDELEKSNNSNICKWILDRKPYLKWYQLPWQSYFGIEEVDKCLEEDGTLTDGNGQDRIKTKSTIYISPRIDTFMTKEFLTKEYYRKTDDMSKSKKVLLDEVIKISIGLLSPRGALIETTFKSGGPKGFYQQHLAGKYFYQICNQDLSKESIQWLGKENGIQEPVDLLDIDKKIYDRKKVK